MSLAFLSAFLFVLLLLIIILTGVEYAYLASNKLTIELKRKQGSSSGILLGRFFDRPETFWNGIVVSFYFLLVLFCFFFSQLTDSLWHFLPLEVKEFLEGHFYLAMILNFLVISFIVLISIGFFAKRVFERYPEGKLNVWSFFVSLVNWIFQPFVSFCIELSEFTLKYLFNVRIQHRESIFVKINTDQFVRQTIQGHEDLDEANKELFDKALQLSKVKVRKCMIPRNETIALDIRESVEKLRNLFVDTRLTRIVIYEKNLDNILGYVRYLDLVHRPQSIREVLRPISPVPETMNAIDLIQSFTKEKRSLAWIVDEFGGTSGFVSMERILEEIFGDISDEYNQDRFTEKQLSLNEYIFSGRLELAYINEKYKFGFSLKGAETISGYVIAHYESIPKRDDKIIIGHFEFDILRVSETRIETVKIRKLPN